MTRIPKVTIKKPRTNCSTPRNRMILWLSPSLLFLVFRDFTDALGDSWGVLQISRSVDIFVDRVFTCVLSKFGLVPRSARTLPLAASPSKHSTAFARFSPSMAYRRNRVAVALDSLLRIDYVSELSDRRSPSPFHIIEDGRRGSGERFARRKQ